MLTIEELLEPIDETNPSGKDLRYDSLIDSIRDARSEDDGSLPMGEWEHQTRRADYPLVASLARTALQTRSKDLWLAVWLGEAYLQIERYDAFEPVLKFLLVLQRDFWASLFPEIEDGDLSLRAAPLHWSLGRYATLLQQFPFTTSGIPYSSFKATRSGTPVVHGGEVLTAEQLDNAVAATPDPFYTVIETQLTLALTGLQDLHLFCEERYLSDGPSFVKLRTSLEELQHAATQISRGRSAPGHKPHAPAFKWSHSAVPAAPSLQDAEPASLSDAPHLASPSSALTSWAFALQQIEQCLDYMVEERPDNAAGYLLALALQHGRDDTQEGAPSSEVRLSLKRASDAGDFALLLKNAVLAMIHQSGRDWVDLSRYTWQAAAALNATSLQSSVLFQTRALLQENPGVAELAFEDDTPVANSETQRWLSEEVLQHPDRSTSVPQPIFHPEPSTPAAMDLSAQARILANTGDLAGAARVLTEDASTMRSGRAHFLRRLDVTRLCIQNGHAIAAAHMLRRLLTEADERKLEQWEDPSTLGELLALLLEALRSSDHEDSNERDAIYARLCQINPAMALSTDFRT